MEPKARKKPARETSKKARDNTALNRQKTSEERYTLRLYVTGVSPNSVRAIENMKAICEEYLQGNYDLKIIDVYKHPSQAKGEQIVAAPTLVKQLPLPLRRLVGDLSLRIACFSALTYFPRDYFPHGDIVQSEPLAEKEPLPGYELVRQKGTTMTRAGKCESRSSDRSGLVDQKDEPLRREIEDLRARLIEAEATVEAIQTGGVDALIISGPDGEKVFALEGADYPYRVIVDVMNEGVVTLGADGGILSCNARFASFLKAPSERILGKPLARFVSKAEVPKLRAFLEDAAEGGGIATVTLRPASGTTMPVNLSASAFEVGGFPALCIVVTNLTEVVAAAATRLRLASIVETSNDAVISESLDNKIVTWNVAAERIYGFSAQEAVGQPVSLTVPQDRIQEIEMIEERIRLGQRIEGYETIRVTKSGTPINVSLTVSPLVDPNGTVTGVSAIARDITERKKAEAELIQHRQHLEEMVQQRTGELEAANAELETRITERKRAEEGLRKSENRLHLALRAAKMATWDWHIPTGEMTWDDEFYRMLGYVVGAVRPSYGTWTSRVHADDRKTIEATFRKAVVDGLPYSVEFRTCWPDGTVQWRWVLGGLDRDITGQVVRSYGVLLDVTEKRETELRIQALNEALQKHGTMLELANTELEAFSHSVSHDLRMPLRLMNKVAHLLLHDYASSLPSGAVETVNMIIDGTKEMERLIESLLMFSRVIRDPLKRRRVDLRRLAQEVIEELKRRTERSNR